MVYYIDYINIPYNQQQKYTIYLKILTMYYNNLNIYKF